VNDFIAADELPFLKRQGLDHFDALWALPLVVVDEPNVDRGGWSHVARLEREGRSYYLKRQRNHLTRSLAHPFGEPTFAREFRNIQRYRQKGIPTPSAVFFAQRQQKGDGLRAILLTRALEGWRDLDAWFSEWRDFSDAQRQNLLAACGHLARTLHGAGQMHGCFYPRHIFARRTTAGFEVCLIDLEKARPSWRGRRDRIKDMEKFIRHAPGLDAAAINDLLAAYLDCQADAPEIAVWRQWLQTRRRRKEGGG
jgi:tRNA A-37 threonylcarbamoyl transferase component Bud32